MSLHLHPHKLDSVEELLLVFSDNVLTAGNRLAMRDLGLDSGQLGHITFQQLFPQLTQTAVNVPLPLTLQRQTYYYRLRADPYPRCGTGPGADAAGHRAAFRQSARGEKMVRLLNAGIALCIEGETGCGKEFVSRTLHRTAAGVTVNSWLSTARRSLNR
jgi:transcriptional regulator of acetoin/glycerol metabolism